MKNDLGALVPGTEIKIEGAGDGSLHGRTFVAKDIFDIANYVTGCGNPDWARTHAPAQHNAWAVQAWLDAGASLVGKAITDELAYSLNGQNFHYGTPINTSAPGRIPGGSSSGSASAVAGRLADIALGTDTGGSIRVPASYCGLYGLRPSHGRVPLEGVMPLAPSMDTVGCLARDIGSLIQASEVLLRDSVGGVAVPKRLIVFEDAFALANKPAVAALAPILSQLETRLGSAERVTVGEPGGGLADWMWRFRKIQAHEIWAVHGAWIREVQPHFGPEIAERFQWAESVSDEEAEQAKPAREALTRRLSALLEDGAVACLPSTPGIAPKLESTGEELSQHRSHVLALTCLAPLTRLPQLSMPLAQVGSCPLGLSLMGGPGSEASLLAFARSLLKDLQLS